MMVLFSDGAFSSLIMLFFSDDAFLYDDYFRF